ncbi:MAG: protein kinase [Sandaracinus sp.]
MSGTQTFGRYRVGRALGRGGMATVSEAVLEGPDGFARRVALKRIRSDVDAPPELAQLFSDEARIASHLHHANLVAILDYGIVDGTPFQALELVDGVTLEALVDELGARGERLPEAIALHVAREVAHGLSHAHRATDAAGKPLGLVHRDVSPSNVLLGWNGDVKLSDFGIAFARGRALETAQGVTRGKPSYMAPEQATRGTLDARTDLFGLGCTLHFALTGRSPLEGDQVLLGMLAGEPAPLADGLAEDVRGIVASAVAPDRRARPASADAMIARLDEAYRTRASRDGRAELRAWLAPLRARWKAPPQDARTEAPTLALPVAPKRSRAWVGVLAVAIAVIALGLGALALGGASITPTRADPAPSEPVRVDATREHGTHDAGIDAAALGDAAPADAAPRDVAPHAPAPSSAPARPTPTRPAPSAAPEIAPTSAPAGSGWVRIVAGCDDARGGAVTIDGAPTGENVPTTARVSVGTHRVRVVAPDGRSFEGTVSVSAFHTEGSPAWLRACGAP